MWLFRQAVFSAILLLPASVEAGTIRALLNQELYSMDVSYTTNGSTYSTGSIGLIQGTRRTGSFTSGQAGTERAAFAPGATFWAFCVELTESISLSTTYTFNWSQVQSAPTSVAGMNVQRANLLAELFYRNVPVLNQTLGQSTTSQASLLSRATQMAIWEIVHEGTTGSTISLSSLNVTAGNIRFQAVTNPSAQVLADTNTAIAKANTMLSQLTGNMANVPTAYNRAMTINTRQDLFTIFTPEPGTMSLFAVGFIALGYPGLRWRWTRRRISPL